MRHLPAVTHRLPRLRTPLPARSHARRRLLLAGGRDVTAGVVQSRHADGLLRGGDVVRHVTCAKAGVVCGDGRGQRASTPGRLHRHRHAPVDRSPRFSGKPTQLKLIE